MLDVTSKDANGRSLYPKLVYPNGPGTDPVKVLNIKEELEVMGSENVPETKTNPPETLNKKEKKQAENKPSW